MARPRNELLTCNASEPPIGIEPMTYALRVTWSLPAHALAALIAQDIALTALAALGLSTDPFHDPFHARGLAHAVLFAVRGKAPEPPVMSAAVSLTASATANQSR
jgi:hypothetical protein